MHRMEPITEDLSLPKQNMFFIEMESENHEDVVKIYSYKF